jgi:tetratricopeptide (TPR) repeat protein
MSEESELQEGPPIEIGSQKIVEQYAEDESDNVDKSCVSKDVTGDGDADKDNESQDSGVESVESDESSFHPSDYDVGFDPDKDPTDMIVQATSLKEEGNEYFKNGDLVRASRAYKKGVSVLKPLNKDNTGDDQVKSLIVALSNNLSMICLKQGKPKLSLDVASKALEVDDTNMKAYYRRAMAHKKMGNLREAKQDLKEAVKCDPANTAVKKELHALVKYMTDAAEREKTAARAVFSFDKKSSVSLYDDKHAEELRKKEEEERKVREEEELCKKRKQDWEDDCVKRMVAGEEAISYEDWDKDRKKKEKEARKLKRQEERRKVEEERKERERLRAEKKKEGNDDDDHDDDDDKLTEKELAQFRGYKKTADGRTTSYFHREQSEHEMKIVGDITPQRLDSNGMPLGDGPAKLSTIASANDLISTGKGKASAWNAGGTTWEEKNATDWCTTQLTIRLKESVSKAKPLVGVILSVDDLVGEASVAVVGGRKRYIFDFHCKMDYEIRDVDVDEVVASGSIAIPDVNSGNHNECEIEISAWRKEPVENMEKAMECRKLLVKALRVSILDFVNDFNEHY